MRALSIQQPWLDRILFEGKDVENRTWRLPHHLKGKRVYLHAGKRPQSGYKGGSERLGAILGEATIAACVTASESPWFEGPFGFVLKDVVAYATPIPWKGQLGFFSVDEAKPLLPLAHRKYKWAW